MMLTSVDKSNTDPSVLNEKRQPRVIQGCMFVSFVNTTDF